MKKCKDSKTEFSIALLDFRNTPSAELGYSPIQLPMSRRAKTLIPTSSNLLKPTPCKHYKEKASQKQLKQAKQYNKRSKPLVQIHEGDNVRVYDAKFGTWEKGIITKEVADRSYDISMGNKIIRRNRVHIRTSPEHKHEEDVYHKQSAENEEAPTTEVVPTTLPIEQSHAPTPQKSPKCKQDINPGKIQATRSGRAIQPPKKFADYVLK
jgi:hypothetical protein